MRADDDLTYQEYKDSVESNMSLIKHSGWRFLNTSFSDPWAIPAMRTISSSYGIQNLTASVKSRSDSNVLSNA